MSTIRNTNPLLGYSPKFQKNSPPKKKATPSRHLENTDGWQYLQDDGMDWMVILIDQASMQVWMSLKTYTTITGDRDSRMYFTDDLNGWGSGMRYLVTDGGKYAEAAARAQKGTELKPALDPLTQLETDARAILVQVASFQGEPTASQVTLFAERLADARSRAVALREQIERIDASLDLAGVAIMDATD